MLHFFLFELFQLSQLQARHSIPSKDACSWFIKQRLSKCMLYTAYDLTTSVDKMQYSYEAQQEPYTENGTDRESKRGLMWVDEHSVGLINGDTGAYGAPPLDQVIRYITWCLINGTSLYVLMHRTASSNAMLWRI